MKALIKNNNEYKQWIIEVSKRFKNSQIKAAMQVNSEMLKFYYSFGKDISELRFASEYGSSFYHKLSKDLKTELPDVKSFSVTNLKYMTYFYETYSQVLNRQQLVDDSDLSIFKIPWGHHIAIINKFRNNPKKAIFYVQKTMENNWSRAVLLNFLDTDLYERQGKAITNFKTTLPEVHSDLAQSITKDPYSFDFLTITEKYSEKELKDALMDNITSFLLELGNGFAFVGREFRLEIGETENFIDMLFYNTKLHCYVVIEVKINEFDARDMGQIGTYIVAVNHQLKSDLDAPTIGLVICKSKDQIKAQYALESTNQPIGISEYELQRIIPENFKGSLPSIEEIEKSL